MITVYDNCREHLKSPGKTSFVLWFLKKSPENYLQDNKIERIIEIHRVWQSNVNLDILIKPRLEIRSYSAWRWLTLNIQKIVCQKRLKLYFHKSPLIPLLHTDHESPEPPRIDFFIRGVREVSLFFLQSWRSTSQSRFRYDVVMNIRGNRLNSAGIAQEFITISEITLEHAARKLRNQLRIS